MKNTFTTFEEVEVGVVDVEVVVGVVEVVEVVRTAELVERGVVEVVEVVVGEEFNLGLGIEEEGD